MKGVDIMSIKIYTDFGMTGFQENKSKYPPTDPVTHPCHPTRVTRGTLC